jgi:hypothetical protein
MTLTGSSLGMGMYESWGCIPNFWYTDYVYGRVVKMSFYWVVALVLSCLGLTWSSRKNAESVSAAFSLAVVNAGEDLGFFEWCFRLASQYRLILGPIVTFVFVTALAVAITKRGGAAILAGIVFGVITLLGLLMMP